MKLSDNKNGMNTSRSDYTKDRLTKLSGKYELQHLLEDIINTAKNAEKFSEEIIELISSENYSIEKINGKYTILSSKILKIKKLKMMLAL